MAQSTSTGGDAALKVESTIEDAGPSRKKVRLNVPAGLVDRRYRETYERTGKKVRLPGFRPGHVPLRVIEQRFGDALVQEVTEAVVNRAIEELLRAEKWIPLGKIDLDLAERVAERGQPFAFEFEIDLRPQPRVASYKGLAVEPPSIEVEDDEVREQLERICQESAAPEPIEDQSEGLTESGTFRAKVRFHCDGAVVHEVEEVHLSAAHSIKGCDEQTYKNTLAGARSGQTVRVPLTFREGFPLEEVIGKEGEVELEILETFRTVVPTPEQLAERAGMDSVAEVEAEIRRQIEAAKKQMRDQELDRQILEQLLRANEVDLPEKLVRDEVAERLEKAKQELVEQGVEEGAAATQAAEQLPSIEASVREFWKALFVKETIAREQSIRVNDKEVRKEIEQIAKRNRTAPKEVWSYYEENNLLGILRHDLHDRKVRAFLRENARQPGDPAPAADAEE